MNDLEYKYICICEVCDMWREIFTNIKSKNIKEIEDTTVAQNSGCDLNEYIGERYIGYAKEIIINISYVLF